MLLRLKLQIGIFRGPADVNVLSPAVIYALMDKDLQISTRIGSCLSQISSVDNSLFSLQHPMVRYASVSLLS